MAFAVVCFLAAGGAAAAAPPRFSQRLRAPRGCVRTHCRRDTCMSASSASASPPAAAPAADAGEPPPRVGEDELPAGVPTFQEAIFRLQTYWASRGCVLWQPYNTEVGAGTMNPATFLRVLGPEAWRVAYDEPSIRPDDSRYGENPNRVQRHTQFQVVLKPAPAHSQQLLLGSYAAMGVDTRAHDVRFVEDNWESPALGAWGLGWEVWLDGMEVTQFTYFQQAGGFACQPVSLEITYGLERILMALQRRAHFRDIAYAPGGVTYGDVFLQSEVEMSRYNLDDANVDTNRTLFDAYEHECAALIAKRLPVPAYNYLLKASHTFNILDARGAVGVTERAKFFRRMRGLAREVATLWYERREELGFPLRLGAAPPAPAEEEEETPPQRTEGGDAAGDTACFALEIGVEELPAADVDIGSAQLHSLLSAALHEARLSFDEVKVYAAPRRLIAIVLKLARRREDTYSEVRGPPKKIAYDESGQPTQATLGFCRKNSVDVQSVTVREFKGQEYVFAVKEEKGVSAAEVLSTLLPKSVLSKFAFAKSMRWNDSNVAFSRPIRWLLAMLDGERVAFEYAGVESGTSTRALRSEADGRANRCAVAQASALVSTLRQCGVWSDSAERRARVRQMVVDAAASVGGRIDDAHLAEGPDSLLSEVTNLIEAPTPVLGRFEESFLALPKPILTTVMIKHQRYFPVLQRDSESLLNAFVTVANGAVDEDIVRAGNEAVLRARYADASFFYTLDRGKRLEEFKPRLAGLMFQQKLGSMLDKNARVERLVDDVALLLNVGDAALKTAQRAAALCKADLTTNIVVEFTSLAGVMGGHYAECDGESAAVAQAVFESVLPRVATDRVPRSVAGGVLSVADRLDSLVGLFAADCAPTANTDVYALRRTAVGLVSILLQREISLDLVAAVDAAASVQPIAVDEPTKVAVREFVARRLESTLLELGFRVDLVRAVLAVRAMDPARARAAVEELTRLSERGRVAAAIEVYDRPARLLKSQAAPIEEGGIDESLFETPLEGRLWSAVQRAEADIREHSSISAVMDALSALKSPVDEFFDGVFVMADDERVRANRLRLCARIAALPSVALDLTQVQSG